MAVKGSRFVHLDMLRGLAAVGVVLGHTRAFVVLDYSTASSDNALVKLFYLSTSLGHQCVIVFFALSGFLVGGPALQRALHSNWSLSAYIFQRLTRLWTVLIPALLLTLAFDSAGLLLGGQLGYSGSFYALLNSGPQATEPADLSISAFLANIMFLQTVAAPVFGTNGPLWSLANEFWYYIIFALVISGLSGGGRTRPIYLALALITAWLLPSDLLVLGLIWGAGVLAHFVAARAKQASSIIYVLWGIGNVGVIVAMGAVNKLYPGLVSDVLLGTALASALPIVRIIPPAGKVYDKVAHSLANLSYTLYANHFPVLAFIWFSALAPRKWPLGPTALLLMSSLLAAAIVSAVIMWWTFERNTDRLRAILQSWLFSAQKCIGWL